MKKLSSTGVCIFVLSGSSLAYEVILVRLLSMTRFYHLTFMVLSLVLLAYGVSGVFLAYLRARVLRRFRAWFCLFSGIFAGGSVVCFQVSQHIPVYPGQWLWSPSESVWLVMLYLILSLPFFAAACGVGLAYCSEETSAGFVYRADLTGAAAGSLAGLACLWLPEAQGLWLPWCGGLTAAALILLPMRKLLAIALLVLAFAGPATNVKHAVRLIPSDSKPLSIALSAEGGQKVADIFTGLGRITVTKNILAPYRYAPGLSLAFTQSVDEQWGAFTDGGSFEPLIAAAGKSDSLSYLDYLPEALAYRLLFRPRVLVLETPVMEHLARAATRQASRADAVVSNPGWKSLYHDSKIDRAWKHLDAQHVHLKIGAPRGFLRTAPGLYDLIVIGPPNESALAAGHLHTVEAFCEALAKLNKNGLISLSGPSDLPPRAGLRLLNTAAAALKISGVENPSTHLAFIRSLRTVYLIVKNSPLTLEDVNRIRKFCSNRQFDPVWFPGIALKEVNRWNRISTPLFYNSALQILGPDSGIYEKRYKFDIRPVFDNCPYFSRFTKPATVKELFDLRQSGALGLLSFAEPVLAATFLQAALLSLLAVYLPLRRFRPKKKRTPKGVLYFLLGAGFMLTEFAIIKKMSLFLNEPVLAVAVTLAAFLAMAGLGGGISQRFLPNRDNQLKYSGIAAVVVAGLIVLYLAGLPPVLNALMATPLPVRITLAPILICPLAFSMGFAFPLAISALKTKDPKAVAWAWGLNGCGSLIGPVLGIVLAIYGGIPCLLGAAALCYTAAFATALKHS
ncbi:MAG: hypothetical protein GY874_23705 [Desulfobacteraceae bacterium]|nr:hypothetical protein [Desulfobacteraceae bacterium]